MLLAPSLAEISEYLDERVRPIANTLDHDTELLRVALGGLVDQGWMALRRPQAYGGPEVDEPTFRGFQELVASASGALAFLQTQHQSAVGMIAKSNNAEIMARVLPAAHTREGLIGIAFSQLRRPGPPLLTATPEGEGYRIEGKAPWATGYGIFPWLHAAAVLPDGRAVFFLCPFRAQPGIEIGPIMQLSAMQAAQTVAIEFTNYRVEPIDVVDIKAEGWIFRNDLVNITLQGFFALGCARAGIRIVAEAAERSGAEFLHEAHLALENELDDLRHRMHRAQATDGENTTREKLGLRAHAIELAVRCAHAGIVATSGAANSVQHPAQRIYREALVFSVSAQTSAIMEATLERLVRRG